MARQYRRHRDLHAAGLVVALFAALALGGCQSPMYSGMPDDQERLYIGGTHGADEAQPGEEARPEEKAASSEQKYEYRGGRDPVTGRANTQM